MRSRLRAALFTLLAVAPVITFAAKPPAPTDAELENLVKRSYPYVAMFNVLSGFVYNEKNPSLPKAGTRHTSQRT